MFKLLFLCALFVSLTTAQTIEHAYGNCVTAGSNSESYSMLFESGDRAVWYIQNYFGATCSGHPYFGVKYHISSYNIGLPELGFSAMNLTLGSKWVFSTSPSATSQFVANCSSAALTSNGVSLDISGITCDAGISSISVCPVFYITINVGSGQIQVSMMRPGQEPCSIRSSTEVILTTANTYPWNPAEPPTANPSAASPHASSPSSSGSPSTSHIPVSTPSVTPTSTPPTSAKTPSSSSPNTPVSGSSTPNSGNSIVANLIGTFLALSLLLGMYY